MIIGLVVGVVIGVVAKDQVVKGWDWVKVKIHL